MPTFFFCICSLSVFAQKRDFPAKAYEIYPTLNDMFGYAFGKHKNRILVIGGKIRDDAVEDRESAFPNTDIIMVDLNQGRAIALSSGSLEGTLAEQMTATNYSFYQRGNDLYIIGGYGYSESMESFITFPYITAVDLTAAMDAIGNAQNPRPHFHQYCEDELALFDGILEYNDETFFILNGKRAYKIDPFEDHPFYHEEQLQEEARTFKITGSGEQIQVEDMKVWYDMEALQSYYGPMLPEEIVKELQRIIDRQESQ